MFGRVYTIIMACAFTRVEPAIKLDQNDILVGVILGPVCEREERGERRRRRKCELCVCSSKKMNFQ